MAVASANVYSGKASLVVTFDSSASTDPDGTIVGYSWGFMDGSFRTEVNPSHEFTTPDTYSETLTVTDDQGVQASPSLSRLEKEVASNKKQMTMNILQAVSMWLTRYGVNISIAVSPGWDDSPR